MISFRDFLPASYEVTFIPLVLAYVFFGLGTVVSLYVAAAGPSLYGLMCLFFLTAELVDGLSLKLLILKLGFIVASLLPATLVLIWGRV
jgi:polyferredoxin